MAQGDVVFFNQFLEDEGNGVHNLDSDTIKLGLTDGSTTPTASTADPRWGAAGTTDFSAEEVTPGGNYSTGGIDVTATFSETGGTATLDGTTNPSWTQNASNPTDATYGILYNSTAAGKNAIAYVDLGGAFDMTTGDLTVTWNASGIGTKTAA